MQQRGPQRVLLTVGWRATFTVAGLAPIELAELPRSADASFPVLEHGRNWCPAEQASSLRSPIRRHAVLTLPASSATSSNGPNGALPQLVRILLGAGMAPSSRWVRSFHQSGAVHRRVWRLVESGVPAGLPFVPPGAPG